MLNSVYVSEEYRWSGGPEAFQWLAGFLGERVAEPARLEIEASARFGWLVVADLPEPDRSRLLRALAVDLPAALDAPGEAAGRRPLPPEADRMRVLGLMAGDVLRGRGETAG